MMWFPYCYFKKKNIQSVLKVPSFADLQKFFSVAYITYLWYDFSTRIKKKIMLCLMLCQNFPVGEDCYRVPWIFLWNTFQLFMIRFLSFCVKEKNVPCLMFCLFSMSSGAFPEFPKFFYEPHVNSLWCDLFLHVSRKAKHAVLKVLLFTALHEFFCGTCINHSWCDISLLELKNQTNKTCSVYCYAWYPSLTRL